MAEADTVPPAIQWRLRGHQYLGDISALCFLHLPPHSSASSLPLLLSGSGSHMFVHSIESGELIHSFQVFEGIRVHGITCSSFRFKEGCPSSSFAYTVVLYGERRVKLFNLTIREEGSFCMELSLVEFSPKFGHWVIDVCFLKAEAIHGGDLLAIGCSDNSISVWDIHNSRMVLQAHSPERSLLYSMRLWGDNLEDLRIASGTIYNQIIVWRVVPRLNAQSLASSMGECASNFDQHHHPLYEAYNMCRLVGHEGSIFRIAWSSDGSTLVSVSDDRSARIWQVHSEAKCSENIGHVGFLFGHIARVWDCVISENLIITASEDCSCCLWSRDGKQLKVIKEHIGRGIWRCLYDPDSKILLTGGFDSGIKVCQLNSISAKYPAPSCDVHEVSERTELFTVRLPTSSESSRLMDSKSEYVRGLCFSSEDTLYVTTNRGYLYQAKLLKSGKVLWAQLFQVPSELPIVCMDLLSHTPSVDSDEIEDWVAVGDGKGYATVIKVMNHDDSPRVGSASSWSAEMDRQLLGIHWCRSLGHRFIFTADPRGIIKLWSLDISATSVHKVESTHVFLLAEFVSNLGARIMCLDASPQEEVLICGDLRGNLVIFPLLKDQLQNMSEASQEKISPVNHFKGAHGISTVSSILVSGCCPNGIEICSTGADGCICYLEYNKDLQIVKFVGMKQVKELSLIESVPASKGSGDFESSDYAAGFASSDFIIWNLAAETKVLQVPCGGWRRPHSYYLGDLPETKNCFAYVKDEIIHIHRLWELRTGDSMLPRNLHLQFHGRELHSLCFVNQNPQIELNKKSSWIVTGCEDGTVRLTLYDPSLENWSSSKLLGEHVGGSAVRSICYVTRTYRVLTSSYADNIVDGLQDSVSPEAGDEPVLLLSVGAKRVLTSWLLRSQNPYEETSAIDDRQQKQIANGSTRSSSISFQWLSTDMPVRNSVPPKKAEKINLFIEGRKSGCTEVMDANVEAPVEGNIGDKYEDDWRYLAVTAFLVKYPGSRLSVCFTVVACSDATLTLRAHVLPYCLWFDVAMLVPLSSPALSLQHFVVPMNSTEKTQLRNLYIVISGATDGSITFWDITGSVEAFMEQLCILPLENLIDNQRRPRTGRGSQGGRWWRSLSSRIRKKVSRKDTVTTTNTVKEANGIMLDDALSHSSPPSHDSNCSTRSSSLANDTPHLENKSADESTPDISEITPLHILSSIHQSGVNCLHASETKLGRNPDGGFTYCIVSGGDDQALNCLTVSVLYESLTSDPDTLVTECESTKEFLPHCAINLIYRDVIASSHSSAVKGVWTDGTWVFSTGLDQRIRCWIIKDGGELMEHAHLIISVPEPEALDVRYCGRDRYEIAVAGRGMQMIEFSPQ